MLTAEKLHFISAKIDIFWLALTLIQGRSGAAIPAYLGTEESWRVAFEEYGNPIDVDCIFEQFDYAIQVPYNSASPRWKSQVLDVLTQVYAGNQDVLYLLTLTSLI